VNPGSADGGAIDPPQGGCGCGATGAGAPSTLLLAAAGLLGLARRRRG
jgi:MYXO-CTERM domain-containing protein